MQISGRDCFSFFVFLEVFEVSKLFEVEQGARKEEKSGREKERARSAPLLSSFPRFSGLDSDRYAWGASIPSSQEETKTGEAAKARAELVFVGRHETSDRSTSEWQCSLSYRFLCPLTFTPIWSFVTSPEAACAWTTATTAKQRSATSATKERAKAILKKGGKREKQFD